MSKFKVGDRVIRVRNCLNFRSTPFFEGIESWEVLYIKRDEFNGVLVKDPFEDWHNENNLELYSPEKEDKLKALDVEAAKAILEAQGYTINEPKSGKLYLYQMGNVIKNVYGYPYKLSYYKKLIAIVPWTEGQGL